ncbi:MULTISPECIES: hypothetical protein [Desulfovibrio]|uniref:Uncharacterized protein n=1 Tax=Desulfovibrio piger TaxID=901 RepID=A0A848CJR1_9BACT|nr:hypothetical protein [Desulfovibrio piger]NME53109.1 hypothetical protein [Desulfovibrio piger]
MATWSTSDMKKDGQTGWLVRLYEKSVNGVREFGLPSEHSRGTIAVRLPTLAEQARTMRYRDPLPPGNNVPSGVIDFLD